MKSNSFIQRSILGALAFLKDSIFAQEYAARNGFLQSLDPRIKLLSFLLLIIQTLLTGNILILFILYTFCLFLALISRIDILFFLKRTLIFIPLFSLFIVLPSIFSAGEVLFSWHIFGTTLMVSRQGLLAAAVFILRVTACVSLVVLLNLTTRHFDLLKVLGIFKIPQIFIMVLGMCYRYIYMFVEIIQNRYLAIKSRVGLGVHYHPGQKIVAQNIASLWQRSSGLNEEVYKAMLARGYHGEALAWNDFKIRTRDWVWLSAVIIIIWII